MNVTTKITRYVVFPKNENHVKVRNIGRNKKKPGIYYILGFFFCLAEKKGFEPFLFSLAKPVTKDL